MAGRPASRRDCPQQAYDEAISKWLDEPPHVEIRIKLGQVLCRDMRQVTPAIVRPVIQLLLDLYGSGCRCGVLQEVKLRHGLMAKLQDGAHLGGWDLKECVSAVIKHLQACSGKVRAYCKERAGGSKLRRFPLSGGFRRSMNGDDFQMMERVCGVLCIEDEAMRSPSATSLASMRSPSATSLASASMAQSDNEWPSMFAPPAQTEPLFDAASDAVPHVQDNDSWPVCFTPRSSLAGDNIQPIDFSGARRKNKPRSAEVGHLHQ